MPRPSDKLLADIDHRFTYHAPSPEQVPMYVEIRKEAHLLALQIIHSAPESRELSLALTHLEIAVMWANAAIARHRPAPNVPSSGG